MLNVIIIEDERLSMENLLQTLAEISVPVNVKAQLKSVRESIDYLSSSPEADIIFSDVQLPDGLSFEIFSQTKVNIPSVFITGYDEFILNAFEYNGIDYLLKPVSKQELEKSLIKYKMLERHFTNGQTSVNNLLQHLNRREKKRLLVRKGLENIPLRLQDIVLFYTENKIVYVIDSFCKKYIIDKNLTELEHELDQNMFFRANRQYIININYIKGYKAYEKVKLMVDLSLTDINHFIIVSQETAPEFKEWMCNA
ncbi:MAG TPA: LytTR family DNA-binding domain-containing protein [Chitinophagaceae bacterium]|jgi:DNA-binding LytR/AlgR family response regulator|nr:LytTR family DNA-binding domain-containing protein [Chitinophagaceae bacterium]